MAKSDTTLTAAVEMMTAWGFTHLPGIEGLKNFFLGKHPMDARKMIDA